MAWSRGLQPSDVSQSRASSLLLHLSLADVHGEIHHMMEHAVEIQSGSSSSVWLVWHPSYISTGSYTVPPWMPQCHPCQPGELTTML